MKLELRTTGGEVVYWNDEAGNVLADALIAALIHLQKRGTVAAWFDRVGNCQHQAGGDTWHVQFGQFAPGGGMNLSDTFVAHWRQ